MLQPAWFSPSCQASQSERGLNYSLGTSHVPHQADAGEGGSGWEEGRHHAEEEEEGEGSIVSAEECYSPALNTPQVSAQAPGEALSFLIGSRWQKMGLHHGHELSQPHWRQVLIWDRV